MNKVTPLWIHKISTKLEIKNIIFAIKHKPLKIIYNMKNKLISDGHWPFSCEVLALWDVLWMSKVKKITFLELKPQVKLSDSDLPTRAITPGKLSVYN